MRRGKIGLIQNRFRVGVGKWLINPKKIISWGVKKGGVGGERQEPHDAESGLGHPVPGPHRCECHGDDGPAARDRMCPLLLRWGETWALCWDEEKVVQQPGGRGLQCCLPENRAGGLSKKRHGEYKILEKKNIHENDLWVANIRNKKTTEL